MFNCSFDFVIYFKRFLLAAITFVISIVTILVTFSDQTFAANVVIQNNDGAGEGFNDSTPAPPVPGNPGTTLGEQRLNVFLAAAQYWGEILQSDVDIVVAAEMNPLFCAPFSATLGSAGPEIVSRDFTNAPFANTWYPIALANSLSGTDLDPGGADIGATFNDQIDDNDNCLQNTDWWYGINSPAIPGTIEFYSTVLHEIGHGLGFLTFVDSTGARLVDRNDHFMRHLRDHSSGVDWINMSDSERAASSIDTNDLVWTGQSVTAASGVLSNGIVPPENYVQLYAPNPYEPGSSVSHWNTALNPDELMEPSATPTFIDTLTINALKDMAWKIAPRITLVWADGSSGNSEVYWSESLDSGQNWSTEMQLSVSVGQTLDPGLVREGVDVLNVVWSDDSSGTGEIFVNRSDDGGASWTLTPVTNTIGDNKEPALAANGMNLYVVWANDSPGQYEVYFSTSSDGGLTWSTRKRLSNTAGESHQPAIALDAAQNLYVVWTDRTGINGNIYFKKSTDGGNTWALRRLTNNVADLEHPEIEVSGSTVSVVFQNDARGNDDINYLSSADNAATWAKNRRLSSQSGNETHAHITKDPTNKLYVVWEDDTLGNGDVFVKHSVNDGATWTLKRLIGNPSDSRQPVVTANADAVHLLWRDEYQGNQEIYTKRSEDGGITWTPNKRVTNTPGASISPSVAE